MWEKSNCSSYELFAASNLICFCFSGLWIFSSAGLPLHRGSLLWLILSRCSPRAAGLWPREAGPSSWATLGSTAVTKFCVLIARCIGGWDSWVLWYVVLQPSDPSEVFCPQADAEYLLLGRWAGLRPSTRDILCQPACSWHHSAMLIRCKHPSGRGTHSVAQRIEVYAFQRYGCKHCN